MRRTALLLASTALVVLLASGVALATVASQIGTTAAAGTTIVVNTVEDESNTDGDCSLREAIQAANTNSGVDGCEAGSATDRDAIHFALGKEATITLGSSLPPITDASRLTINGQKAEIAVSGRNTYRPFEVSSGANLALNHLTVTDGSAYGGGGLFNDRGTVRVRNSTFSGNTTTNYGGGILNNGTLTVTNSTFSENGVSGGASSLPCGGGICNTGTLTVTSSTFSENGVFGSGGSGGGINNRGGTATLRNTIVANSSSGGNCAGLPITDAGYNIEDGTSCGFSEANNSMPSTEPKLAASLADNGGPTNTIKLRKGSPAINAIPKATNGCGTEVKTDQRGVKRPQGKKCDISAFEKKVVRR